VAVAALLGCGSSAGSLDGKVLGHEVSVKEAVFIPLPNGEIVAAAGDQENLCAILNGQQKPTHEMNLLETYLVNFDGEAFQPLVTGDYKVQRQIQVAGLYSYPIVFWTSECITFGAVGPTGGTIKVESYGGPQQGAHLAISVDLSFAESPMTGHLDAVYCRLADEQGAACYPQLRHRSSDDAPE
jgi:hypothetical protein